MYQSEVLPDRQRTLVHVAGFARGPELGDRLGLVLAQRPSRPAQRSMKALRRERVMAPGHTWLAAMS